MQALRQRCVGADENARRLQNETAVSPSALHIGIDLLGSLGAEASARGKLTSMARASRRLVTDP